MLAGALALAWTTACGAPEPLGPTRHAVLICMDTVRYDVWRLVQTLAPPPEDSPWRRALRLRRAQSTAPWTLPALASVFTGLHPNVHVAGVFPGVANFERERPAVLREEFETLTEQLRREGFATASFNASGVARWGGVLQGFEHRRRADGYDSRKALLRKLSAWLDHWSARTPERRFFAYLHFMEAHQYAPKEKPENVAERIGLLPPDLRERAIEVAPGGSCAQPGERCETWLHYVASVLAVRDAIGSLLQDLARRELLDDTAVVLFADHGEEFYDHREISRARGLDPRGDYARGHGHTLFQEQLHVPLVVWHPDSPGGALDVPVSLVDVAPTLQEWLDVEGPEGEGMALGGVLAGRGFDADRPLYASGVAFGPRREAVLRGGRKRISGGGHAPPLAFDLGRDPREMRPLAGESAELARLLADYREQRREPRKPMPIPPDTLRALQELGYLGSAPPPSAASGPDEP